MGKNANGSGTPPKKMAGRDLYRARYTDANGKQKSVYHKDYNECRKLWIEALSNKDKGLNFDSGKTTVAEHMTRWIEDSAKGDLAPRTYHNYKLQIRHSAPVLSCTSTCAFRWRERACMARSGKSMVRRDAFFGSENSSFPGLPFSRRIRCSWRFTRSVLPSNDTSDHLSPNASPIRRPQVSDTTYKHSKLSPLALSSRVRACCASRGVISS